MLEPNPYAPPLPGNHEVASTNNRNRDRFAPGELPLHHPIAAASSGRSVAVLLIGLVSYVGLNEFKSHEYITSAGCGVLDFLLLQGALAAHRTLPDLRRRLHDYREEYFERKRSGPPIASIHLKFE